MARKYSKISNQEKEKLLREFCGALSVLRSPQEITNFITDLFTKQEMVMLAKRIKIAKFLIEGKGYRDIESSLNVGHATVAKVSYWLSEGGEGFRTIAERTKEEKAKENRENNWQPATSELGKLKRRYPSMFWPQLLVEDIVKTMNKRQKEKVRNAVRKLDQKSTLYKQMDKILK